MSFSSGTGAEVLAAPNGLGLSGSLSSSDEESSPELEPPKHERATSLAPGTMAGSPSDTVDCESRLEACRDAQVETVAVYMCTVVEPAEMVHQGNAPHITSAEMHEADPPAGTLHAAADDHEACLQEEVLSGEAGDEHPAATTVVTAPKGKTQLPSHTCPKGQEGDPTSPQNQEAPRPTHVMAQVHVRPGPEQERVARGMQDSKSLDEISRAYGEPCGRGGHPEGRRATISSALELEGTVSHDGDLTHFIASNLEHKIKMSHRLEPDSDSHCAVQNQAPSEHAAPSRSCLRPPPDIPPIDPNVLLDLQRQTQAVAQSLDLMMRGLSGTVQNMTALSVGYIQTYRDSVDSVGESVDMSIKGMYTLMARCEELDRSMQPIHQLAKQIRDIKTMLDTLEALCK
ncbi:BLOC-1-related complex subunit 6 isoform X1 [Paramormyrops kingsleyae]|uniref:BLOC-1 related complex subunit 6 n=2 Tax=Paramormyrops kingsleyae TaxID=1676925 RepID=A0A3B3SSM3_9TELE|nr:BLOC-1-related complex subunit 6-like isoform X1 [Paramormyrops kingsleyae]XP_023691080.1 BLOC-1-related complex subunit 6-like isoform X1 [Paramormyrops kingsleyae]XP_023691081.1 BLOC-1-related complex subunit 6-like isoform X1 [Paramormyrops kingsleyae]XP_023691082.1 BLOC-1-related complex subunit 6-like isoform X1 [Paramormyrops kingsleyae]